jgi:hypothetical protein
LLGHVLDAAVHLEGEHGRSKTTSVAEHADALALQSLVVNIGEDAGQAAVDTTAVHVSALGGHVDAGLHAGIESLLSQTHEDLLNRLVGDRGGVVHISQLGGHLSENGVCGVCEIIVVQEARVRLSHKLASRGVERHVVETVKRRLLRLVVAISAIAVLLQLQSRLARVVGLVAGVHSLGVAANGEVAVYDGVLARKVGLVEVVCVLNIRAAETGVNGQGSVGADEHGDTAGSTGRASIALLVERDVAGDNNGVTTVPRRGLDPVDAVEQGVGAAVAGIDRVHTLDVVVAGLVEQLHQDGLDRLGLVEERLGTDFEAANRLGVNAVLLEERRKRRQGERVDICAAKSSVGHFPTAGRQRLRSRLTLTIVTEGHLGLAEANGVFALGDAIELLEVGLVDALHAQLARVRRRQAAALHSAIRCTTGWTCLAGEVQLNGLDANVRGTGGHDCKFACGVVVKGGGGVPARRGVHRSFK